MAVPYLPERPCGLLTLFRNHLKERIFETLLHSCVRLRRVVIVRLLTIAHFSRTICAQLPKPPGTRSRTTDNQRMFTFSTCSVIAAE